MRTRAAALLLALLVSACVAVPGDSPSAVPAPRASVVRQPERPVPDAGWIQAFDRLPSVRPTRPVVRVPEPPVRVVARESSHDVQGAASWYCGHGSPCTRGYPGGLYAAAGPALRVGRWRGRVVLVRSGTHMVRVTLIDCNCGPHANLIDLYGDAFERLAPPSRGVLNVTVEW